MTNRQRIVFDLDHTICIPNLDEPDTYERYARAKPIQSVIDNINRLSKEGYYIIIYTARRMITHQGDIEKIKADVGSVTSKWLKDHEVEYNELVFGKPYADTYYVDDKAMDLNQFSRWMNNGEYRSR